MVKYKNISGCNVIAIVNGKLIVLEPDGFVEARSVVAHPGLELVEEIKPKKPVKKVDKKRKPNNGSETKLKELRE